MMKQVKKDKTKKISISGENISPLVLLLFIGDDFNNFC